MALLTSSTPEGALTDRERLWAAMRELRTFTMAELCLKSKVDRRTCKARDYLTGLVRAGIVDVVHYGPGQFSTYTLVKDCGVCAPRVRKNGYLLPDSGRTRMWLAMPILGTFTIRELAAAASLPDASVSIEEAKGYCCWLTKGGYLHHVGTSTYRFVPARATGPKAPQILRDKQLYDPNIDKVITSGQPQGRDDE